MASAELLMTTQSVDGKVVDVDDRVKGIEGKVQDVRGDVQDVGDKVQDIDDKLYQAKRSLSFEYPVNIPTAQTASQGTISEIIFYEGYRPQIRPQTIILHATLVTTVQLNGL
jgi:hypothetical protein